jgi:taurine dioxygenase
MSLTINRLGGALGAEVIGLDLTKGPANEDMDRIHQAWLDHSVLVMRDQQITPEQQLAFARRFGTAKPHHLNPNRHPDFPELLVVSNERRKDGGGTRGSGQHWHSDYSYLEGRSTASILRALQIPSVGGDTMFANAYRAHDALSETMRNILAGLTVTYDYSLVYQRHYKDRKDRVQLTDELRAKAPPSEHPIIETHAETGRKLVFFDPTYANTIVGMEEAEYTAVFRFLTEHLTRPEFIYRHHWKPYDMVMWDNRCTLHCAVSDYDDSERRHLNRVTVTDARAAH